MLFFLQIPRKGMLYIEFIFIWASKEMLFLVKDYKSCLREYKGKNEKGTLVLFKSTLENIDYFFKI